MATLKQKIAAERAVREMLEDNGLPEPDRVEYGSSCIRFLFEEPKLAVVIEVDEFPVDPDDPPGRYGVHTESEEAA